MPPVGRDSGGAEARQHLRCRTRAISSPNQHYPLLTLPQSADIEPADGRDSFDIQVPHMIYHRSAARARAGAYQCSFHPSQAFALDHAATDLPKAIHPSAAVIDVTAAPAHDGASCHLFPCLSSKFTGLDGLTGLFDATPSAQSGANLPAVDCVGQVPPFVRPLPGKIAAEDVRYLQVKDALTLPEIALQNALLRGFIEYVYPYMPLLDLHEFLGIVNARDGSRGQTSLLLYQAVMFSVTAFVDMKLLREAGYITRKTARKVFFRKTRLLYDFDYEADRLVLVQALMLMTYWYETPDDQKDTWHWMGVAVSLAHTIGLHRNPEATSMPLLKQRLWRRIWWSCFMRDRLIAFGMRRPTRIKDEDFNVPMLVEADFEIGPLAGDVTVIPADCVLMRDVVMQRELATLCIAKAKLCVCVSHMLRTQYSVLIRDKTKPENTTNSTMMLFPNKQLENVENVHAVDLELNDWLRSLPPCCLFRPLCAADVAETRTPIAVQRTLLHMVYHTTISALHRPQFLPASPSQTLTTSRQAQEVSRQRVRDAAAQITQMAKQLHHFRLERYLPTTGVTVILPAMIIHLLEMRNPSPQARERATHDFRHCMRVMEMLRDSYSAADYATGFLDAALRKAAIDIKFGGGASTQAGLPWPSMRKHSPVDFRAQTPPPENMPYMTRCESLFSGWPKHTASAPGVELLPDATGAGASPPPTDHGSADRTPSTRVSSVFDMPAELEGLDLDFMQGHDEFDWNAVAGTDFDVDQWLQFPEDGVASGLFGTDADAAIFGIHGEGRGHEKDVFGYDTEAAAYRAEAAIPALS